jgi:hypothetical protein
MNGGFGTGFPMVQAFRINSATGNLSANVGSVGASFVDIVTVSLVAGTWAIRARLQFELSGSQSDITARLWDGTTTWAEGDDTRRTTGDTGAVVLDTIVTLTANTNTVKLSAACNAGATVTVLADPLNNSSGTHKATYITAIRIG